MQRHLHGARRCRHEHVEHNGQRRGDREQLHLGGSMYYFSPLVSTSPVMLSNSNHGYMNRPFGRALFVAAMASTLTTLGACSDSKEVGADLLEAVESGFPRDSLFQLMGKGPLTAHYADTLRVDHGFRLSKYFVNGDFFEVVYFREAPGDVAEPVKQAQETPVILRNGKVLGWGWRFYVEEGIGKLGLPTPLKEAPPSLASPTSPPQSPDSVSSQVPKPE